MTPQISIVPLAELKPDIRQEAVGWIYNSWLRSWEHQRPRVLGRVFPQNSKHHYAWHYDLIGMLMLGGVWVAHDSGAQDLFRGWICGSNEVCHYVYVKGPFRRRGIGTMLARAVYGDVPAAYSHDPRFRDGRGFLASLGWCDHQSYLLMQYAWEDVRRVNEEVQHGE